MAVVTCSFINDSVYFYWYYIATLTKYTDIIMIRCHDPVSWSLIGWDHIVKKTAPGTPVREKCFSNASLEFPLMKIAEKDGARCHQLKMSTLFYYANFNKNFNNMCWEGGHSLVVEHKPGMYNVLGSTRNSERTSVLHDIYRGLWRKTPNLSRQSEYQWSDFVEDSFIYSVKNKLLVFLDHGSRILGLFSCLTSLPVEVGRGFLSRYRS